MDVHQQDAILDVTGGSYETRTDNDTASVSSRPSLRAERKRLDQNSRGARLNFRKGSPLGHTIEELDDRGMIDGGDTVPSYEASFKQRSRRPLEMRRRSSRLRGRGEEKHSPKIVNSFFHMVQVLIRRGLNFDEMLRQYDEEGNGLMDKEHFIKVCLSLGLPFGGRSLSLVYNRFAVSGSHIDYEALLQELYHGVSGSASNLRTISDEDSMENGEVSFATGKNGGINTILLELRRMLRESAHAFNKSFDDIYRMFSRWDVGGTGTVTATQFLRVLSHLHIVFSEQDQDLMVELFDSGGEGRVDFDSLLTFCFQSDSEYDAAQSPFAHKSYSYFGDDNTTSNSALSVGSVDNGDTSVEKLEAPSPDLRQAKGSGSNGAMSVNLNGHSNGHPAAAGKSNPSPEKTTARSNSSGFQGGRPRPHTAGGDKRGGDNASVGGGSNRGVSNDSESPMHRNGPAAIDVASNGSNPGFNNGPGSSNIESPTSRARRMVRPMTAAPRVPLTVSVPREQRSQTNNQDMDVSVMDEFVVDVLSDDDVLDGDEDAMDLRSYEAATDKEEAARRRDDDAVEHVDEYNALMKEERDIRQFKSAAAQVVGPVVYGSDNRASAGGRQQPVQSNQGYQQSYKSEEPMRNRQDEYMEVHRLQHDGGQAPGRAAVDHSREVSAASGSRPTSSNRSRQPQQEYRYADNSYPPTFRAEPAAALKMLRRDIIHRHQKSGKTLYDIFRTFDVMGNRYFYAGDLQRTMMELALPVDDYQAAEMIKLMGLDGEDRVCFAEFAVFITDPDFPTLAERVQRIVAETYEKQGREYQLKLYNITTHGSQPGPGSQGYPGGAAAHGSAATAITGFISKAAFESALSELGLVGGNGKSDSRAPAQLLNSVEVSRLCVRFDTHGRDLCSVAKFLRMVQNSPYWRAAEQNVIFMEEAAEEAQTAREELAHYPSGVMTIGPPPGYLLNEELIDMAEYLGIRVLSEPYLLQIVDNAVRAPVPEGWSIHTDKKGRNFFFHQRSGRSQWDHPADDDFRCMRDEARAMYSNQRQNHQVELPRQDSSQQDVAYPGEQSRRLRPVSAKGGGHGHSAAVGHQAPMQQSVESERHMNYYQQLSPMYGTPYGGTPYNDGRVSRHEFENPRQETPAQGAEQPSVAAIGDAVVQAVQSMDPKELLKLLNKNGDLLTAIGVPKARSGSPTELTPQRSRQPAESTMKRNNSAPAPVQKHAAAVVMVPPSSSSASTKKPLSAGGKRGGSSSATNLQKKHASYRHNGSGMFDPMRADRERMHQKQTHNWTAPSAVDRALGVGNGNFGAAPPNTRTPLNADYSGGASAADRPAERPAGRYDAPASNTFPPAELCKSTPAAAASRPKSGSSIRRKIPPADDAGADKEVPNRTERPKTGVRSARGNGGSQGPVGDDIYGDKLLSRLDTLVARHHSP